GGRAVSWELFVGLRYLRARRRTFLSLISLISLLGVTIGVATLDIVLAVMTGFEQDLRDKILGMNPHIVVVSYGGPLAGDPSLVERSRAVAGVVAAEPFVYGQAMLAVGRSAAGVVVRGIDPQMAGAVVDLERHLESGTLAALAHPYPITLPPEEGGTKVELPGLLIGAELARQLGVGTGDVVNLISPLGTPGPTGMVPRMKRFVVAGLFDSGMFDYDTTLAYMALGDAQRFFELKGAVTGIEVRVRDVYGARAVARQIEAALGGFPYRARDWMEVNRNLFSALKLEKVVYGIVLCLIVVLAGLDIEVEAGERLAIVGESGVGKSTLLHLLGALDQPTGGRVLFDGVDVFARSEAELALFRNREIGFVFQFHHLLGDFTALENVMLPSLIARQPHAATRARATELLAGEVPLGAQGEPSIARVGITGNLRVEEDAIRVHLRSQPGQPFDQDTIDRDIRSVYAMGFFDQVDADVTRLPENRVEVVFRVKERPLVRAAKIEGNKKVKREGLEGALKIRAHTILDPEQARQGLEAGK